MAPPDSPQRIVAAAASTVARRRWLTLLVAVPAAGAAAALGLVAGDALLAWDDGTRWWLGRGTLAGGALAAATALAALPWLRPRPAAALALAEQALDDRERHLTAALQLGAMPGELAAAGAGRLAAGLPLAALPARLPRARWRAGAGLLAASLFAGAGLHLAAPGLLAAVWPRLADPAGDHPPWARVRLAWAEAPASVRAGAAARFSVAAESDRGDPGALAPVLVLRRDDGRLARIPMYRSGQAQWSAEALRLDAGFTAWAEAGGTRTHRHLCTLDPVPELALVDCVLVQPAYAGLADESQRAAGGRTPTLAALPGARLRLLPQANRALAALWLARDGAPPQRVALAGGAAEVAAEPGTWSALPEAADGVRGEALALTVVNRREDRPPRALVLQPPRDAYATPLMRIPFAAEADDDLGLAEVVRRRACGLPAQDLAEAVSGLRWRWEQTLDLGALGVRPGEVLVLALAARDRHPDGGQTAESEPRTITVVDDETYNRELRRRLPPDALKRKYGELARRLRELEESAKALREAQAKLPKDELDRRLGELAAAAHALAGQVKKLRREKPLLGLERDLQREMEDAAAALAAAAERGMLDQLGLEDGAFWEQELQRLTDLARTQGLLQRLALLADAEQNLTTRLEELAGHRRLGDAERVRLRELAEQQQQLAETLDAWQQAARDLAQRLRSRGDLERAEDLDLLANELGQPGLAELARRAAAAARSGDAREAARLAGEVRERLLALLPRTRRLCQGLGWCDGATLTDALNSLGSRFGIGLGGMGMAGLGAFLGYGGDDAGASMAGANFDLYGPENLGDLGSDHGDDDQRLQRLRALAAQGGPAPRAADAVRSAVRGGAADQRVPLGAEERRTVGEYFRKLGEGGR